jgi:hypothetical protein
MDGVSVTECAYSPSPTHHNTHARADLVEERWPLLSVDFCTSEMSFIARGQHSTPTFAGGMALVWDDVPEGFEPLKKYFRGVTYNDLACLAREELLAKAPPRGEAAHGAALQVP